MRLTTVVAATAGLATLATLLIAAPSDAVARKRVRNPGAPTQFVVRPRDTTVITTVGEDGIVRTRYVPVRRSFLDPGTEVAVGELPSHTGLSVIPAYSPLSNIDVISPNGPDRRQPLNDPWDVPSPKW